jgi:protein-S-isoprenylcysteine O-methyltransferase Ste14
LVLPLVLVATPLLAFADYDLPAWATVVGAAVQLPLLWLFWRSHTDLAGNWSPGLEVREEHGLVTHGIYTHIRHPMYAALWLWALSQPLLLYNWIAAPSAFRPSPRCMSFAHRARRR